MYYICFFDKVNSHIEFKERQNMTKFKTDENLGKTVDKVTAWCFGVEPIESMWQLRFAGGGHKFSQLCAFKFHSVLPNHDNPDFSIAFVAKLRSHIYHRQDKNPSQWYIFKKISPTQTDVLGKKELFANYGFDIDKFFDSDMFKATVAKFKQMIQKGLTTEIKTFIEKNPKENVKEIERFKNSIAEGMTKLDSHTVNDKYYKLFVGSYGDKTYTDKINSYMPKDEAEDVDIENEAELDKKIDEEFEKKGIYSDVKTEDEVKDTKE